MKYEVYIQKYVGGEILTDSEPILVTDNLKTAIETVFKIRIMQGNQLCYYKEVK